MKRILKILAVVVVLVLAGTYLIYVLDYKGNYNVSATVTVNVSSEGSIALTQFDSHIEPTSVVQFWDLFRQGAGGFGDTHYKISWELNYSDKSITKTVYRDMDEGGSAILDTDFGNIPAGTATLKVTVRDMTGASLCQKSYPLVIG